jgi:hypothetical protein
VSLDVRHVRRLLKPFDFPKAAHVCHDVWVLRYSSLVALEIPGVHFVKAD